MQKYLGIILLCAIIGGAWYASRQQLQPADPLRSEKLQLEKVKLERLTELERQRTEEAKRETLREQARLERQTRLERSQAVSRAAITLAVFWRMLPVLMFGATLTAGLVYAVTRRVSIQTPQISGAFPRKDALKIATAAITVSHAEAAGRVLGYSEDLTRARLSDMTDFARAIRAGRENITVNQSALPVASEPLQPMQAGNVTFQQAVKDFRQGSVLLGYRDGRPEYIDIDDFVSAAVGGASGSGKTSKLRFLLAQLIVNGVNVSILDAHAGNEKALVDSLGNLVNLPNVRIFNPFETQDAIETMIAECQAAIQAGKPADVPYVYVLDELRPISKRCQETENLMDILANESNKFRRYGLFSSQTWEASLFTQSGSAARDACVFKAAAKMPRKQAHILFADNEAANTVSHLQQAEMYADSMKFPGMVVNVPFMSRSDCDTLAAKYSRTNAPRLTGTTNAGNVNDETPETSDASQDVLDGHASNVIPFPVRNTNEPTNQPTTAAEPNTFDAKKVRESFGMSQGKFADLTGCSLSKLKRVETGNGSFDADEISMILTNLDAWQASGEPANQVRTNGEPGMNQTRTTTEPTNQTREA